MKGVGLTIGFWAAAEIVSGGSPDPLQAFTTPKSKMMEELSRLGIRCVDANADPKKFIETYLGGSTGTSAALDSLAIFVPKAHLTHPTPHGLPKQLQSAAYGGNMYHACDLWKKLVDAGGEVPVLALTEGEEFLRLSQLPHRLQGRRRRRWW